MNSSRIPNRRVFEVAFDALGLSLDAAEVSGSGLDALQLGPRRGQFRDRVAHSSLVEVHDTRGQKQPASPRGHVYTFGNEYAGKSQRVSVQMHK